MNEKKCVSTSISVPKDLYEFLREKAFRERRSASSIILEALNKFFSKKSIIKK